MHSTVETHWGSRVSPGQISLPGLAVGVESRHSCLGFEVAPLGFVPQLFFHCGPKAARAPCLRSSWRRKHFVFPTAARFIHGNLAYAHVRSY